VLSTACPPWGRAASHRDDVLQPEACHRLHIYVGQGGGAGIGGRTVEDAREHMNLSL
jgi:hypothetical protein